MKRKKLMALGMVLTMTAGILSGCGGQAGQEGNNDAVQQTEPADTAAGDSADTQTEGMAENVELTFWMQSYGSDPSVQREALDKLTAEFKEQTGITVNYVINDWNSANQKLTLACTGGEAPDVADIFFTRSFAEMSSEEAGLLEINDVVEEMGGENTWLAAGKDVWTETGMAFRGGLTQECFCTIRKTLTMRESQNLRRRGMN